MKVFSANNSVAQSCFNKFKYKAAITFVLLILFMVFEAGYSFHKHHETFFTSFLVILAAAFVGLFIFAVYNGILRMNMMVKKVEMDDSHLVIETFGASMLFNLIKKQSQVMTLQTDLTTFARSTVKSGFDPKYTGDIYLLQYAGDEYLIPEKFFETFSELQAVFK